MHFKFWQKKEKKSYCNGFLQLLIGNNYEGSFLKYYLDACPVFTATKMIADAISSIPIVLKDSKGDFIYEHKALTLLTNPNPFTDGSLFMKELASFYLLTGNAYIDITGEKEPVELNNITPSHLSIQSAPDGYADSYLVSSSTRNLNFTRSQDKRFLDARKNELVHLRDFNPEFSSQLIGTSAFAGCELEIEQYILASMHNNALLKNGARPSGILTYDGDDMSQEQADGLRAVIQEKMSGAKNAGTPAFFSGRIKWQQVAESMRDMDFPSLKKSVSEAIYSAVKIPLPMVSPENMSFANMDASKYVFYDNAVLPVFKRILKFLTAKLLIRYPNAKGLEFSFDESSIEALESRKYENAKTLWQLGILSDNELRGLVGYEAANGGDVIYKPSNILPIGQDTYTADNRDTPKKEYIRIMQEQKRLDGGRLYTDEYILLKAKEYYGD